MEYRLFNEFVRTFLLEGKDFISGSGERVWTPQAVQECIDRFIKNYIGGSDQNFSQKLRNQFATASREARILFAHAIWLYVHGHKGMTDSGKKTAVMETLADVPGYVARDDIFLNKGGIANGGTAYNTQKPANIRFLIYIFKSIKSSQAGRDEQSIKKGIISLCLYSIYGKEEYLNKIFNSDITRQLINELDAIKIGNRDYSRIGISNFLLNFCNPDYYERIVSFREKEKIAEKLFKPEYAENSCQTREELNTDDQLYWIVNHYKAKYPEIDPKYLLHDPKIRPLWNTASRKPEKYWVFQCNPDVYNILGALIELPETKWRVTRHANEIKIGDGVILWVTGKESGCYALGQVIGEIEEKVKDPEEKRYYWDESYDTLHDRVPIRILHNLADYPILKEEISGIPELADLNAGLQGTNFRATKEQYEAFERLIKNRPKRNYWLFSPGNNAKMWETFYKQGYMAIGWPDLGDLEQYKSLDEILANLQEISGQDEVKKTHNALTNWQFLTAIKPGDVVIAKQGRGTLLGYGEVKSEYYFDPTLDHYQKCRRVDWKLKGEWQTDHSLAVEILTDISDYTSDHPDYEFYYQRLKAIMGMYGVPYRPPKKDGGSIHYPLNLILFGPPGTGKTYRTIDKAVAIAEGIPEAELKSRYFSRKALTRRYKELVDEGRIVFTTFHQSMSYEDFIEGIKPETQDQSLKYNIESGIFKELCWNAMKDKDVIIRSSTDLENDESYEAPATDDFERVYDALVDEVRNEMAVNGRAYFITKRGMKHEIKAILPNDVLRVQDKQKPAFNVDVEALRRLYYSGKDPETTIVDEIDPITRKWNGPTYQSIWKRMHRLSKKINSDSSRPQNATYKSPAGNSGKSSEVTTKGLNYVLIIDEINRGNVSQIFGELITLIEEDKRAGASEALEIKLPYSGEKFSVPPNLFIIGTMNTADRSIEALDTALRRRFTFQEMLPLYRVEDDNGQDMLATLVAGHPLKEILGTINRRIEILLDRDHQIGHSYFLGVKSAEDLKEVLENKVIPLLQEYFYGDYGKIGLVLGQGFVEKASNGEQDFSDFDYDDKQSLLREVYKIKSLKGAEEFEEALESLF